MFLTCRQLPPTEHVGGTHYDGGLHCSGKRCIFRQYGVYRDMLGIVRRWGSVDRCAVRGEREADWEVVP